MILKSFDDAVNQINTWHHQGLSVGLVTGVFDIIHTEHQQFLGHAAAEADKLIVGVEPDDRVRIQKGPDRPINSLPARLEKVQTMSGVSAVFKLPLVSDWLQFMRTLHPDIYCVSSQSPHLETKQTICHDARVTFKVVHQHNPAISTTKIIEASRHI